jgi:EAL domain-containing protein (putative c-di-GMP-specific phosphodiesterase class I)/CheY-like chemotaxis protein
LDVPHDTFHPVNAAALRFLVVEDHDFQRRAVLKMLAGLGATDVLEASDGAAALRLLQAAQPPVDVVISDLNMPGMDGIEFIRTVGSGGQPVAIIAVSAADGAVLASVESMAAAYRIPLLGVLAKPLTPQALQAVIARHRPGTRDKELPLAHAPLFSEQDIRGGLSRAEFEPFFQPKVLLADGRLCGFEALARWRHPELGIVGPRDFLQLMEDRGSIDALTWLMLKRAAACCAQWRRGGHDISVAVNLSVHSLREVQVASRVEAIVAEAGLDARHMVLELTESAAAGDRLGQVLENLARLRLKGFGLSLDDFGTGYSSVQQLSRVAFTELKIDRSFVHDAASSESAMIVLQSSLDLARRLKLRSVAEGVETEAEWQLLRGLGCDAAQGYYIARPMEGSAVPAWIHSPQRASPPWPGR